LKNPRENATFTAIAVQSREGEHRANKINHRGTENTRVEMDFGFGSGFENKGEKVVFFADSHAEDF
jgi:hypothetical protein